MAQFRTTADILDEILAKAGEPTNGNSPFETTALTYANKVHHAIIGGGNIFDIECDEPWVWARAKHPIVLELQPAYTTGALTCTNATTSVTFSTAPTSSLEGWHLQVNGKPTVYKISQHTAATTGAELDSNFIDSSGSYNFRAFKLDYEILPTFVYIDNFSDKLDFQETATTTLSTTLTHGAYSPSALISHIATKLGSAGTASYTGTYDSVLKTYSLTSSVTTFKMFGVSGPNARRSVLPRIGFDRLNHTGATSYTSTYTPNQVARLMEPFKLFSTGTEPFIYSTDPIKLQEDYPISLTGQRVPDRFARITEENDGTVWVRFNSYPANVTKVAIDWIPQPIDLQDNSVSVPEIPRGDMDVLIHGAAAYLAMDKEDDKSKVLFDLTKAGLEAMRKKNRALLFRTGESFGQMVPRADLVRIKDKLNYGYLVSGSTNTTVESVQSMVHVSLGKDSFTSAMSTATSVTARTLLSTRSLFAIIAKHSTSFAGTGISAVRLDVGIASDPTKFINGFDVYQSTASTAQDSSMVIYYPGADTAIEARLTTVGGNLSALTAGVLELYFEESVVP